MREYELMFVVDPRLTDEETVSLTDQYKEMIVAAGGEVYREESWGKRKLAYQINKLSEGSYMLFYVRSSDGKAFTEVEQRLRQNENILRFMTVRTDAGRLRRRGSDDESQTSRGSATSVEADDEEDN